LNLDRRSQLDEIAERLAPYQDKIVLADSTEGILRDWADRKVPIGASPGPYSYSDERVRGEVVGEHTPSGIGGHFSYSPVRPGTVTLTCCGLHVVDDGNGNLIGDVESIGINAINYATGGFDVTFSARLLALHVEQQIVEATYDFSSS